jgi:hypothetical protein
MPLFHIPRRNSVLKTARQSASDDAESRRRRATLQEIWETPNKEMPE